MITPALEKLRRASRRRQRGCLGGESFRGETRTAPGRPGRPSLPTARRPPVERKAGNTRAQAVHAEDALSRHAIRDKVLLQELQLESSEHAALSESISPGSPRRGQRPLRPGDTVAVLGKMTGPAQAPVPATPAARHSAPWGSAPLPLRQLRHRRMWKAGGRSPKRSRS